MSLNPEEQPQSLEDQVKALRETVDRMTDTLKQTTATQNQLARAALAAKEIADTALSELGKTRSELEATKLEIQKNMNEALPEAIKKGMTGFALDIQKATDARITAVLQSNPAGPEGADKLVQTGGGFGGLRELADLILNRAEDIEKLVNVFKPKQPEAQGFADKVMFGYKYAKMVGKLQKADASEEELAKAIQDTFGVTPKV